jgi:hypothetical protein
MNTVENAKNQKIFELADKLKAAKEQKKALEAETDDLTKTITGLDRELSDAMAEAELEHFSRNGTTFYLTSRLFASPKEGQKDGLMKALKAHGYGALVVESVNAQTLSSFCKEQIELSGEEEKLPGWLDACVSTFEKVSVGIRKGAAKKH